MSAQFSNAQLDQMLAPIALYPDPLLAQVLMAATYPLEIVQADRWLQSADHAALHGEALTAALDAQPWDPSVKSLLPFPQVLRMLDNNLTWTEQLGDAFLAEQATVMDAVQRLRGKAQAAGRLTSTSQAVVSEQGAAITIEPADPAIVYVPVYNPNTMYGVWPYPGYPPYYYPFYFSGISIGAYGFGWLGIAIDVPLWGWGQWDWGRRRINVNGSRFSAINAHRAPIASGVWQHDASHRGGVPYRDAASRTQFQGTPGSAEARRSLRGYAATPNVAAVPRMQSSQRQVTHAAAAPPAFESFGGQAEVRSQAQRGHISRQSMPAATHFGGGAGRASSTPAGHGRARR